VVESLVSDETKSVEEDAVKRARTGVDLNSFSTESSFSKVKKES
jgi:hypothetical protein